MVEVLWYISVIGFNLLASLASNYIIPPSSEACSCPLGATLSAVWPHRACYRNHVLAVIILNPSVRHWNTNLSLTLQTCDSMDRTVIIGLICVVYQYSSPNSYYAKTKHREKALKLLTTLFIFIYLLLQEQLHDIDVRTLHASSNTMRMTERKKATLSAIVKDQKCLHKFDTESLNFWKLKLIYIIYKKPVRASHKILCQHQ